MDQLHTANKVCGGCSAISLNTVDTESSVSPIHDTDIFDMKILESPAKPFHSLNNIKLYWTI